MASRRERRKRGRRQLSEIEERTFGAITKSKKSPIDIMSHSAPAWNAGRIAEALSPVERAKPGLDC